MACTEKGYWFDRQPKPENLAFGKGPHAGFTGKRGDRHFYKGVVWLGPTNSVGQRGAEGKIVLIKTEGNTFGYMPV